MTLDTTAKLKALKSCDVLKAAGDDNLHWLADRMQIESFAAGEVVFDAGDHSSRVYVVAAGSLEVRLNERSELISFFEPGAVFGEYAMFVKGIRMARVVAATPSLLLGVDDQHFRAFLLRCPEVMLTLLQTAVRRLHRAERHHS